MPSPAPATRVPARAGLTRSKDPQVTTINASNGNLLRTA
jgi:hypothetical protein